MPERIQRLSQHPSPFSEVADIERMWDISEAEDENAEEDEETVSQHVSQSSPLHRTSEKVDAFVESPTERESPISQTKSRVTVSPASEQQSGHSRTSVKRSAEFSPEIESESEQEDPVKETQKKKPLLRFRKLKVARQLFEHSQTEQPQLENLFSRLDIGVTPAAVIEDDVNDEEPISIRSDQSVSSFSLTRSPAALGEGEMTPEAAEQTMPSSPKSWNSHSCEHNHSRSIGLSSS